MKKIPDYKCCHFWCFWHRHQYPKILFSDSVRLLRIGFTVCWAPTFSLLAFFKFSSFRFAKYLVFWLGVACIIYRCLTPRISFLKNRCCPYPCPMNARFISDPPRAQLSCGLLKLPNTLLCSWLLATCEYFTTAVSSVLLTACAHCGCVQMETLLIKARNKTCFIYGFLNRTTFVFQWKTY